MRQQVHPAAKPLSDLKTKCTFVYRGWASSFKIRKPRPDCSIQQPSTPRVSQRDSQVQRLAIVFGDYLVNSKEIGRVDEPAEIDNHGNRDEAMQKTPIAVTAAHKLDQLLERSSKYVVYEALPLESPANQDAHRMLSTSAGLESVLSTLTYSQYLLAYLEPRLQLGLVTTANSLLGTKLAASPPITGPSRFVALGTLLFNTRTALRLFNLPLLYTWTRNTMDDPYIRRDAFVHTTTALKCGFYMTFQCLENVAFLTEKNVLPVALTARWNPSGEIGRIYLWACRAWLAGVVCDILRLAREAYINSMSRTEKVPSAETTLSKGYPVIEEFDWWLELAIPVAWLPMATHFSIPGGLRYFNDGWFGACGMVEGLCKAVPIWLATATVK